MRDITKLLWIIAGSVCMAIGIHFFLMPHLILDGGLIGIALLMNYLWGFRIGVVMLCCSVVLFAGFLRNHREMVMDSLFGMLISSWIIDTFAPLQYVFSYYVTLTPITSALCGGIGLGAGFAMLLRCNITTGGTDFIAHLLSRYVPLHTGCLMVILDVIIISLGGLLISAETFWYSLITVAVGGVITIVGMNFKFTPT